VFVRPTIEEETDDNDVKVRAASTPTTTSANRVTMHEFHADCHSECMHQYVKSTTAIFPD